MQPAPPAPPWAAADFGPSWAPGDAHSAHRRAGVRVRPVCDGNHDHTDVVAAPLWGPARAVTSGPAGDQPGDAEAVTALPIWLEPFSAPIGVASRGGDDGDHDRIDHDCALGPGSTYPRAGGGLRSIGQ